MLCQVKKKHKIEAVPTSECNAHLREKSYPPCSFHRGGPVLSLGSKPRETDRTDPLETGSPSPPSLRLLSAI